MGRKKHGKREHEIKHSSTAMNTRLGGTRAALGRLARYSAARLPPDGLSTPCNSNQPKQW